MLGGIETPDGLAGGSGMASRYSHHLYFGKLVFTLVSLVLAQRIIDSGVVAMLRYAIENRKEAKLSSDRAQSADTFRNAVLMCVQRPSPR